MTAPTEQHTAPAPSAVSHSTLRVVGVGIVAGFLSGLFGVGGGILIVPALVLLLHFTQRQAHGTSLAAVLPISISSTISYAFEDKVDWTFGMFLAIGAVAGAVLGTYVLNKLPHDALAIAFSVLLAASAIRLLLDHTEGAGRDDLTALTASLVILIGLATGVLAGLLGVGGGVFVVPVMVVFFGIPAAIAKGTSLAMIVPTSIMGTWRNRKKGNADLRVALWLGLAGVVSAFLAGKISVGMSEKTSNILFAILLLTVGGRIVWQVLADRRKQPDAAAPA